MHIHYLISNTGKSLKKFNCRLTLLFSVKWALRNSTFKSMNVRDQVVLLEDALNKLLLIDVASQQYAGVSFHYVKYIIESYFIRTKDKHKASQIASWVESMQLSLAQLNHVKLIVTLQTDKISKPLNWSEDSMEIVPPQLIREIDQKKSSIEPNVLALLHSVLDQLDKSHFHSIHCTMIRWILSNCTESNQ